MTDLVYDRQPVLQRPDAGTALLLEWNTPSPEARETAVRAWFDLWKDRPWPTGLLSHNVYAGLRDGSVMLYAQWTDADALQAFRDGDLPERLRLVEAAVPGMELRGAVEGSLYRAITAESEVEPGCIVIVTIRFEASGHAPPWIDSVLDALDDQEDHSGGLGGYFHISTDGTTVVNYAEWIDEEAHRRAIEGGTGKGVARTESEKWERVQTYPALVDSTVRRYRFRHGIAVPPAGPPSAPPGVEP